MANMSYCRFQNTLNDLRDCANALEELQENEVMPLPGGELSMEEAHAAKRLIELCKTIAEGFEHIKL